MITAVDSSVILDVLTADARFGARSLDALRRCLAEGALVASAPVWAEIAAGYEQPARAGDVMDGMEIAFESVDRPVALAAGSAWRAYRLGGGTRRRILTDFLIAAHALERADRLLTRDRGFYRSRFPLLEILDPSAA